MFLIKSIMTKEVVGVEPDSTIDAVSKKMASHGISSVIVMEGKNPIGIISERDFVKKILARGKEEKKLKAKDVMSFPLLAIKPNDTIIYASKLMRDKKVRHFIVMEDKKMKGIVTETDLVKGESEYIKAHQILQNLVLTLFMTLVLMFVLVFRLV
jgi:CBS domain-containing protein